MTAERVIPMIVREVMQSGLLIAALALLGVLSLRNFCGATILLLLIRVKWEGR